ncbi:sensor histidine kinase [Pseudoduganella sp. HUAS MS19]
MTHTWSRTRVVLAIVLASVLLHLQGNARFWINGGSWSDLGWRMGLGLLYFAGAGIAVWLAASRATPWLARRLHTPLLRMLAGSLLLLCALAALTGLVYAVLFPWAMGRPVTATGLYAIAYKVTAVALLAYCWLWASSSTRSRHDAALSLQAETDRLAAELERAELAVMQAQIEPHFLFNTLALVKRRYRTDPAQAAVVMDALVAFLESAAPALRQDNWTLGQELDLVQLYLDILGYRFGASLEHAIAAPPACRAHRLPALVLATLVENAVRHGLAPKAGTGRVNVAVRQHSGGLHIEVADDGVGLRQQSGSGLGLSTVRARLRSAFGNAASLLVQPGQPCGVRAVLTIAGHAA